MVDSDPMTIWMRYRLFDDPGSVTRTVFDFDGSFPAENFRAGPSRERPFMVALIILRDEKDAIVDQRAPFFPG